MLPFIFRLIVKRFIICVCSLFMVIPNQLKAENDDPIELEDESISFKWSKSQTEKMALIIGGAALAGGLTGAITGYACSQKHSKHHHKSSTKTSPKNIDLPNQINQEIYDLRGPPGERGPAGERGPSGPNPFLSESAETLIFTTLITITSAISDVILTPFVATPNGLVIKGTPIINPTNGMLPLISIPISNPVFGNYRAGFNIESVSGGLSLTLVESVETIQHHSNVILLSEAINSTLPGESQIAADFTYLPNTP